MLTAALDGLVARFGLQDERLGEVAAGAVLKHSRDFNLTRESVLGSKLAPTTPAYDVQQACGTGLETAILVANKIALGQIESGIAGGVDTTSDAPIAVNEDLREVLLDLNRAQSLGARLKALGGLRPGQLVPAIPQNSEPRTGLSMGEHQAITTREWGITREAQDELAAASHQHLAAAYDRGFFDDLVTPFLGLTRDQNLRAGLDRREAGQAVAGVRHARRGRDDDGRQLDAADRRRVDRAARPRTSGRPSTTCRCWPTSSTPRPAAVDYVHGDLRADGLLMAPVYALPRLLARNNLTLQDFDFYEIHEAFASTVLTTLAAWEDDAFCKQYLGLRRRARLDRPRQAQRQRLVAGGRAPVRRYRRTDRGHAGQAAARERRRPRADLDLRRRRPGRRRDPGRDLHDERPLPEPGQLADRREGRLDASACRGRPCCAGTAPSDPIVPGPVLLGSTSGQVGDRPGQDRHRRRGARPRRRRPRARAGAR